MLNELLLNNQWFNELNSYLKIHFFYYTFKKYIIEWVSHLNN